MQIIMQIGALQLRQFANIVPLKKAKKQNLEANLYQYYEYGHWQLFVRFVLHIKPVRILKIKNNSKLESKFFT